MRALIFSLLLTSYTLAFAEDKWPQISDLEWSDNKHLQTQREWMDDLTRLRFGEPIRGNLGDLTTLQRIIDESVIDTSNELRLQAMGVVLGDVFVEEHGLEWRIYRDEKGRSRATCVPKTEQCLFPITMLSRRITVGLKPNVEEVYKKASDLIKPYLPKLPYQVD